MLTLWFVVSSEECCPLSIGLLVVGDEFDTLVEPGRDVRVGGEVQSTPIRRLKCSNDEDNIVMFTLSPLWVRKMWRGRRYQRWWCGWCQRRTCHQPRIRSPSPAPPSACPPCPGPACRPRTSRGTPGPQMPEHHNAMFQWLMRWQWWEVASRLLELSRSIFKKFGNLDCHYLLLLRAEKCKNKKCFHNDLGHIALRCIVQKSR